MEEVYVNWWKGLGLINNRKPIESVQRSDYTATIVEKEKKVFLMGKQIFQNISNMVSSQGIFD